MCGHTCRKPGDSAQDSPRSVSQRRAVIQPSSGVDGAAAAYVSHDRTNTAFFCSAAIEAFAAIPETQIQQHHHAAPWV